MLKKGARVWDLVLPQLIRAFTGTPHSATGETAKMLLLGREQCLPDQVVITETDHHDYYRYVLKLLEMLEQAHNMLQEKQLLMKTADSEEPPLFRPGDLVLLVNKRRRRRENPKLQPKFVGRISSLRASITKRLPSISNQLLDYHVEQYQQQQQHIGLRGRAKRVYRMNAE